MWELEVEAVRFVREFGVAGAYATRNLEIHERLRQRRAKELSADSNLYFHGYDGGNLNTPRLIYCAKKDAEQRAERRDASGE